MEMCSDAWSREDQRIVFFWIFIFFVCYAKIDTRKNKSIDYRARLEIEQVRSSEKDEMLWSIQIQQLRDEFKRTVLMVVGKTN